MFFAILFYRLKWYVHFLKTGLLRGVPAARKYAYPARNLHILAITGTDGKTTSTTLLYRILQQAGKKVALVSTVAAYIGDEEIDTGFHVTSPSPDDLQKFMRQMVDKGIEYLVLEATSQGVYQSRLWGIQPEVVGYTNITPEHLDYHITYDLYVEAKAELGKRATKKVIINADDEMSVGKLRRIFKDAHVSVKDYTLQEKLPSVVEKAVRQRFTQTYNWQNARLVYEMAKQMDIEDEDIAKAVSDFTGIPGRMEKVAEYKGAEIIVDFAHTANGLLEALTTLRDRMNKEKRDGQLIAVFGCAGLRDRKKRPIMGRTAAEIADIAIFTAEDPRTENVWGIIRQMKSQLTPHHNKVLSFADRGHAIEYAIEHYATPGSIIGIFGKGHEHSMCYGTIEYPWNDSAAVLDILHPDHKKHLPSTAQLKGRHGDQ